MCRANGPQGGWGPLCSDPHCTHGTLKTEDRRETMRHLYPVFPLGGLLPGGGGGPGIGPFSGWPGWSEYTYSDSRRYSIWGYMDGGLGNREVNRCHVVTMFSCLVICKSEIKCIFLSTLS